MFCCNRHLRGTDREWRRQRGRQGRTERPIGRVERGDRERQRESSLILKTCVCVRMRMCYYKQLNTCVHAFVCVYVCVQFNTVTKRAEKSIRIRFLLWKVFLVLPLNRSLPDTLSSFHVRLSNASSLTLLSGF